LGIATAIATSLLAVGGYGYTDLRGLVKEQYQQQQQQLKEQYQQQQQQAQAILSKLDDLNGNVKFYTGQMIILKDDVSR